MMHGLTHMKFDLYCLLPTVTVVTVLNEVIIQVPRASPQLFYFFDFTLCRSFSKLSSAKFEENHSTVDGIVPSERKDGRTRKHEKIRNLFSQLGEHASHDSWKNDYELIFHLLSFCLELYIQSYSTPSPHNSFHPTADIYSSLPTRKSWVGGGIRFLNSWASIVLSRKSVLNGVILS